MEDISWKMLIVPILILFIFIGGIIGVVNWQKSRQTTAPSALTVNIPEGEVESAEKELTVTGKVKKGDKVYINNDEAKVEKDGSFTKIVTLNEGDNKIVVTEKKNGQEVASVERTVKYVPTAAPAPAPSPETQAPSQGPAPAPQPQVSGDLSSSGPEEIIIPVVGAGGVVLVVALYLKSRKHLTTTLKR